MDVVELLEAAYRYAVDKNCVGDYATDAAGNGCSEHAPEAARWCAIGGLYRVSHDQRPGLSLCANAYGLLSQSARQLGFHGPTDANDKGACRELYDRAIAIAKSEQSNA